MQSLLTLDHCVGIIGGKPKHSVYFVGFQGTEHPLYVSIAPMANPPPLRREAAAP